MIQGKEITWEDIRSEGLGVKKMRIHKMRELRKNRASWETGLERELLGPGHSL